jgi:hypothetical protein
MRITVITLSCIIFSLASNAQSRPTLSSICRQVSTQWILDSNSCKGNRLKLAGHFSGYVTDSITRDYLFSTLGKPNQIQEYIGGYPERKHYVEYIYFIYKDNCPNIRVEGASIGFVFDETEIYFIRIDHHDYCG